MKRIIILLLFTQLFAQTWEPSMGMRHPDRPCMKVNSCGQDSRSQDEKANDPNDTNHPQSQEARANEAERHQLSTSQFAGEVSQLNARIAELESENARLVEQQGATANPPDYQPCGILTYLEENVPNRSFMIGVLRKALPHCIEYDKLITLEEQAIRYVP